LPVDCGGQFVKIRTITGLGETKMEAFTSGTLAGAGSFRCESCGFAVALHERDEVPSCPRCEGGRFRRASIFEDQTALEPFGAREVEVPGWLSEARDALLEPGWYLAYAVDDHVRVLSLQEGWTRIGRSLAAHVRFDDPTVSRRHALLHCDEHGARILDDRSLNGVFLNGERIDWHEVENGDEIVIGRFRLYFLSLAEDKPGAATGGVGTAVG
jgi:FHA domain/Zinc-ribbon containing domain